MAVVNFVFWKKENAQGSLYLHYAQRCAARFLKKIEIESAIKKMNVTSLVVA